MRTDFLFDRYYRSRPGYVGGTEIFHALCAEKLAGGSRILEIGAGPANPTTAFLATLGTVVGVDVSEEVRSNFHLSESHVYEGGKMPFREETFDLCVSNYVLEHVTDPRSHFEEVSRILRPGGAYCFRTPNRWHYITIASSLLPYWIHVGLANKLRGLGDRAHSPWPTLYRANDRRRLFRIAREAGFSPELMEMVEKEPSYGAAHWLLFFPMMLYEKLVNSTERLSGLRVNIFGALRKPLSTS